MKYLLALILWLFSLCFYAQTGEKNFIDQNYIEVTGKAEMEVVPDQVYIRIGLNEKDIKGKSIDETEKMMTDKLKDIGIDIPKDLSVKDLTSYYQNYLFKSDIQLSKQYELLVHDARTAGQVFNELKKLGISNAYISRIENSKISDYRKQVKVAAVKAAQEKAKALVTAINQDIGKAIFIQESDDNTGDLGNKLSGRASGIVIRGVANTSLYGSSAPQPDVDFEKIHLEYSVLVRFDLK